MKTDNLIRSTNKDSPSLKTLEDRLNNIESRIESLRDHLRACIEQTPTSDNEKDKYNSSPTLVSLDDTTKNIQSYLAQCEELISRIRTG